MQPRRAHAYLLAAAMLWVLSTHGAVAQSNNDLGTWVLNVAKSTYTQGPPPKSSTLRIEPAGRGVKVTVDQVLQDGSKLHWEYTSYYDGKDSRVIGNNPNADTVVRTRLNAATIQTLNKKGGKVTTTNTAMISADGKTRSIATTGTDYLGQKVYNIGVYEKR